MKNKNINSDVKRPKKKSHPFWSFFWLTFLVVSLGYAWYSFYAPSNEIKWVNISNQELLFNNSNKYSIVFFTGEWCSPCRIMKREVCADQKVEEIVNSKFRAIMIDVGNPETNEIVNQYKTNVTPTTIILDSKGKVIERIVGKIEKNKFLEMLLSI
ncbi:thioredoxin fold domain-containing protein [Flagellimonas sp.]|uniref:thioredoxin fold domain-containing protein n=1 Tax=Flagellimonas sp. TaxID=2058762 RepID=UPI003BA8801A